MDSWSTLDIYSYQQWKLLRSWNLFQLLQDEHCQYWPILKVTYWAYQVLASSVAQACQSKHYSIQEYHLVGDTLHIYDGSSFTFGKKEDLSRTLRYEQLPVFQKYYWCWIATVWTLATLGVLNEWLHATVLCRPMGNLDCCRAYACSYCRGRPSFGSIAVTYERVASRFKVCKSYKHMLTSLKLGWELY